MSLWRTSFWRTYWIALRRSKEDRRARFLALRASILLLLLLANVVFWLVLWRVIVRSQGGVWAIGEYAALFMSALLVRFLLNRSNRSANEQLSYSLTGSHGLTPEGTLYVSQEVRNFCG